MDNSEVQKTEEKMMISSSCYLAKFLSIDLSIKIFGHEILAYHLPPKKSE